MNISNGLKEDDLQTPFIKKLLDKIWCNETPIRKLGFHVIKNSIFVDTSLTTIIRPQVQVALTSLRESRVETSVRYMVKIQRENFEQVLRNFVWRS